MKTQDLEKFRDHVFRILPQGISIALVLFPSDTEDGEAIIDWKNAFPEDVAHMFQSAAEFIEGEEQRT